MSEENNQQSNQPVHAYDNITILKGLEPVRIRPGMYIGDTNAKGLHHMVWEIVDNSIDEAMAGFATRVIVTLTKRGTVIVDDDGRGIPVGVQANGLSGVETALCELHAGGKFDNETYKVSGGLHGVGASVVNALSQWMKVWVCRNDKVHYIEFDNKDKYHDTKNGHEVKPLSIIGDVTDKKTGTQIEFYPDFSIMEKFSFDHDIIAHRLQQLAYLNKGLKIIFDDQIMETKTEWMYEGGLQQYTTDLNRDKETLVPTVIYGEQEKNVKAPTEGKDTTYNIRVEVAFQYNKTYIPSIYSFCNNINTTEGGTHEEGFKLAITKIVNRFAVEKKYMKEEDDKITKDDVLEGLTAIISVKHPNPQYKGQTKGELGNSEVRPLVNEIVSNIFEKYMLENPDEAGFIIKKVMLAQEARKKSQEAREATRRKSPFDSSLPGKLTDCEMKDNTVTELYIVEGDSAGGSAKQGRAHEFQAILPLKGKILNVEKAKTDKIFNNDEIMALITAIGAGVNPEFDLTKIRYNKIIIMTDADVDGAHIRILLLTFFFRYMKPLIEQGHIYAAQPPLYKFISGKTTKYVYTDQDLEDTKKSIGNTKFTIQRYKGLGEMDAQQLWETTMDPENRILHKVTIDDAIAADQKFSFLMGDDVQPRKDFISQNAKFVKNLDI